LDIQVDGGINSDNLTELIQHGANRIVSGSHLLKGDLKKNIEKFKGIYSSWFSL